MAYFGGNVSPRPWSRFDAKLVMLLLLSVAGIVLAIMIARDSMISELQNAQNNQQPATVAQPVNVETAQQPKTLEVLVAADVIAAGTRLKPAMFRLETRNADNGLAERAMLNLNEIEGSYARVSISQGTPLLKDSVAVNEGNMNANITERIPPGYRAVAIPVNIVTGVEGWVQPGARVDVVWTAESRGKLITTTLIENAQVLSAARRLEGAENTSNNNNNVEPVPSHVTLLVTTSDSQRLQLAKNSGSLSLSLRGDRDVDSGNASTLTTDSIIKNRNQKNGIEVQGKVSFGGQEYVLSGSDLIPQSKFQEQARARMKDSRDE